MFDREQFEKDKRTNARAQAEDGAIQKSALNLLSHTYRYNYGYQWSWLGLPIIQMPPDILAVQEIIWDCKPDIIIETGIAWGGSVVLYASILHLIGNGKVIAVDKVLPANNRKEIMKYPFADRIQLFEGPSTDPAVVSKIMEDLKPGQKVMVLLDSNHTHDHVLQELELYAPLVTLGQYLVISDTIVEEIPDHPERPRPWGKGNNPKTALDEFLSGRDDFIPDEYINQKLLMTYSPGGYLKRVNS